MAAGPEGGAVPGATPRDSLRINPDEELGDSRQRNLRVGLAGLPAPRNEFEIVMPEDNAAAPTDNGEAGEESGEALETPDQVKRSIGYIFLIRFLQGEK